MSKPPQGDAEMFRRIRLDLEPTTDEQRRILEWLDQFPACGKGNRYEQLGALLEAGWSALSGNDIPLPRLKTGK